MASDPRQTPAMRQFARFKARHPDCILLFRMGDFYETFDDDAVAVSKALGLTLTQRTEGVPMAGVPYHQLEVYLRRLVQHGFRVAVCDQVQDPREAKGIVERDVTQVITPGTLVDENLLDAAAPNRLAAAAYPAILSDKTPFHVGVAILELSTGAVSILDCDAAALVDRLAGRGVSELLYPEHNPGQPPPGAIASAAAALGIACTPRPAWEFRHTEAVGAVLDQYGVASVAGFGLREDDPALAAVGAAIRYLRQTQPAPEGAQQANTGSSKRPRLRARTGSLTHLQPPKREDPGGLCVLDAVSLRSLEVECTLRGTQLDGSLLGLFLSGPGACVTPMGRRLVREWLCRPLGTIGGIESRHACVAVLVEDRRAAAGLVAALDGVQDVARIAGRLALGRATPRDLVALARSLARVRALADALQNAPAFAPYRTELDASGATLEPIAARITGSCVESPPTHMREGGLFRDGIDAQLDEARSLQRDASTWLVQYQQRLIAEHKLPGIKVGFNRVFGYYIELTASQARSAPDAFSRKQTLRNAERYTTPELKEFEDKVTTAESRAIEREQVLFDDLCALASGAVPAIAAFARTVAELDVLACFADRAVRRGWARPTMHAEPSLAIKQGRHPVLESLLGDGFVPNDVELGAAGAGPSLALITGPNMAGKSTFIRQVALIVLLAHAGSFVPAEAAAIGLADRIFTRVGADDALHAGQSTFMVEMIETANILNNATGRSLIILDEIGRGTSTLDGLSLAWAVAEHLAQPDAGRTLFATHYHELTELEDRLPGRVRNLHVAVREWGDQIVFLHRILPGRTDRSYGVHVARLAGIPTAVTGRAREILETLAVHHHGPGSDNGAAAVPPAAGPAAHARDASQLSLFTEYLPHPALGQLREIKLDSLTPIQAFDALRRLKGIADKA